MDVTCERCSTAYEFDDALVSERGTTVKCTNCGHQFKVRRPDSLGVPERWLVRTLDGRELEFRALRELQAAIAQSLITREDVLSRGGSRPRRLASIAELEPFFASAVPATAAGRSTNQGLGSMPRPRMPTPQGLGAQRTEASVAIPLPRAMREALREGLASGGGLRASPPPHRAPLPVAAPPTPALAPASPPAEAQAPILAQAASGPMFPPPDMAPPVPTIPPSTGPSAPGPGHVALPATVKTLPPPPMGALGIAVSGIGAPRPPMFPPPEPAPNPVKRTLPVPVDDVIPSPAAQSSIEIVSPQPYVHPTPARPVVASEEMAPSSSGPDHVAMSGRGSVAPMTPTPSIVRSSYMHDEAYDEPRFSSIVPTRRTGATRWIVGIVITGLLALMGVTVGRKLLSSTAPAASSVPDARVGTLLQEGEKSLLDGDLESAKEKFDKASVLVDRDPRVTVNLARLAAVRADVSWLRVRLLPDNDPDLSGATQELAQAADRARKAADLAVQVAPTDPATVRVRVDALRVAGDLDGARKLVGSIASASSQPENALTLAALDLADAKPDWTTVVARLRSALAGEQNLGRARAFLVYALARSGDSAGATTELSRLSAPRPHALARALRIFIARAPSVAPEAPAAPAGVKAVPVNGNGNGAPAGAPSARPRGGAGRPPAQGRVPDDYVAPSGTPDTTDLPGAHAPAHPSPGSDLPLPPTVDTSDLPGFK